MAGKKKRRRHAGVAIISPEKGERRKYGYRIRYVDPDTGKTIRRKLDPALRTRALRIDYACRLSEKLARRRMELETGAVPKTGTDVSDAVEAFFNTHPHLRPRTLKEYRRVGDKFVTFCRKHNIRTADDIDRRKLMRFRETLINERVSKRRRAARTINKELTGLGTILRYLVKREEFSKLRLDDVIIATENYGKNAVESAQPMTVEQIQETLEACIEHDAAIFEATRDELRNGKAPATARHRPIAPFVLFSLLTGVRPGEARQITWDEVDDDAIAVGNWSKTGRTRRVTLNESPAVRRLLDAQFKRTADAPTVWEMTDNLAAQSKRRLVEDYDAPDAFGWQVCRATCQSYLASSPTIYGGASVFIAAKRGGHSVQVCERHYAQAVDVDDPNALTLEGAMGIEEYAEQIIEAMA